MRVSAPSEWLESQIERALLWFLRILLGVLLASALLRTQFLDALVLGGVLLVHAVLYALAPRILRGTARTWVVSILDVALISVAFYLTGAIAGPAGILGLVLAGILAARLGLWPALGTSLSLWSVFTFPFLYDWLVLGEAFDLAILANAFIYLALAFAINYLAAMEARQIRLGKDASWRFQHLAAVHEANRAISTTLEIESLLDQIVDKAIEMLGADSGALLLVEPGADEQAQGILRIRAIVAPGTASLRGETLPPGTGAAARVLETGEALLEQDPSLTDPALGPGLGSLVAVPLVSRGRVLGVLEIGRQAGSPQFQAQDVDLLATFGGQAAIALENALLFEQTSRHLQHVNTLYEVGRALATLDTEQVLSTVAREVVATLNADVCAVFLRDRTSPGRSKVLLAAMHDPAGQASGRQSPGIDLRVHHHLGRLLRSPGYIAIGSVDSDEHLGDDGRRWLQELGVQSALLVGLIAQDEFEGFVVVAARDQVRTFSVKEIELCQALGRQAAVAVQNAQIYERTDEALDRRLTERAVIEEIDRELRISLDLDHVLQLVLRRAIKACDASSGDIGVRIGDERKPETRAWHASATEPPESTASTWSAEEGLTGRVMSTGQPAFSTDLGPGWEAGLPSPATCIKIAVPILSDGSVIGVIDLEAGRASGFDQEDLRFLEHLAEHAGIAIENVRMFRKERERVQMLSALGEISREIRGSLDLDRTLNLILSRVRDLVDYQIAEICLWDEASNTVVTCASAGDPAYAIAPGYSYRLDEGFTGWIARHRTQLLVPDVSKRQDIQPKMPADNVPVRSYVGLPLAAGETFVGTLELASGQAGLYGQDDLEILQIIADQAAAAIQHARLYEEVERRFEQTQLLLGVSERLASTLNLAETVHHVAREMCLALGADVARVYLVDEERTHLQPTAEYPVQDGVPAPGTTSEIPIEGHAFVEEALQAGHPAYALDPAADPRLDPASIEAMGCATVLFAPMVARDEVIGGVYLGWVSGKSELSDEEVRLATSIASQAATIVQNSRLFDGQQRRVRELGILFETSAAISSSLALDEVLRTVAVQMARALDVSSCSISDWDPDRGLVTTLVAEAASPDREAVSAAADVGQSYALADYPATARVLDERRPLVVQVDQPGDDPDERALLQDLGQRSLLMIPLVTRDRVVGLAELYEHRHQREFSSADLRLGTTLASQAAVSIENARLYGRTDDRLQARLDELTAMQRITRQLSATLDLDGILQTVLDAAIRTTGATHGNVMLVDPDTGTFALRAAQGYSDEERSAIVEMLLDPEDESIVSQVVRARQPYVIKDTGQEPCSTCVKPGTMSALGVPIFYERDVVGLINLRHLEKNAFEPHHLSFVQSLAEQAAVAIGNALRFEQQLQLNVSLRTRADQMSGLLEVSRQLRADVPLEDTLEEVAYAIQETVGFDIVLISVCEGTPAMMRRVAAAGLPLDQFQALKQVRQPADRLERLFQEQYQVGACYFYPFQKRDEWEAELHTLVPMPALDTWREGEWHPNDMLLVPLRGAGGRLLGHISVDSPRDGLRPSRQTLEALTIFANQAAVAVENANLYADAQRRADSLALINEVGRTLTQVLDPERVLKTVVRAAGELLDCERSIIFQADSEDGKLVAVASHGVPRAELDDLRFAPGEGLVGRVAATQEPLLVANTEVEPDFVKGSLPTGSLLLVPMMVGTQLLGVLTVSSPRQYAISEAGQLLLTTLADQGAVALESARLFASTQQAALRLSLLNEIGRRAAAQLELQEMLETAVQALHQSLGFFRVAVLLREEAGDGLRVVAANDRFWSVISPDYRLQVGEGLIGTVASTGEMLLVNDTAADPRFVPVGDWTCASSLSVPIRTSEGVIGVLHAEADRRLAFSEQDAAALALSADQLAVAIQNARLFGEIERRVAELATINQIGQAISSALEVSELYDLIYNQVSKLLDSQNFHIALYDAEQDQIRIEFLIDRGQPQEPAVLSPGQGLTGYVIESGKPVLVTHGSEAFAEEHGLSLEGEPVRSWLGVPMIAEDRVIGAIAVQSLRRDNAFDAGHRELLTTIAGQAAIAFQNARLFEERERRIGELAVLNEMARAISSTLELEALLELVYRQTSRLMDTTDFFIALYDQEEDEISFPFVVDPEQRGEWQTRRGRPGLVGRVVESRQPLLLPGAVDDSRPDPGLESDLGGRLSWLGVPMIAEDKVLGVIAVQSYEHENLYDEEDLAFLTTVASQSAMAVRNAQLYRQIVRFSGELEEMVEARTRDLEVALNDLTLERDRVEALYRITRELGATLELERVLQRALQLFADVLNIEHGSILLLDQETGQLVLRATLDDERILPREGKMTRWKPGAGLAGWVLQHRKPVLVDDVSQDPRWVHRPDKDLKVGSVVAAPLSLGGGDVLGVLILGHGQIGYFTQDHLQLVTAAAVQVAIAVNNSDLYAFISDQADQLGAALQAQQEEIAKSRAILESIADGVLVLDQNGRVLLANPAAEELLGFAAQALEGEHFRHILGLGETPVHRELAQALYGELREALDPGTGGDQMAKGSVRLEAGSRVLAMNTAPLVLSSGSVAGVVAALRDISREAEVERLKNEFISTVSHELRTPMTSIKGYTDLLFLGMAGGLTDAQRNFLQIIKSNADRLTALVNDILDISRIETGRIGLVVEALHMTGIIDQVVASFREQYREKGVSLHWQPPEDLSQVRGDATRVTQVLSNLLANAWHYTPPGGRVTVEVREVDPFVQVDVVDTGIGIAAEDLDRIFDRFYRADHPLVQEVGGTGLGLSIVKMFVEILGGEVWVHSEPGGGSTFSFTLPLMSSGLPAPTAELLTPEQPSAVARGPKVLVVEDDRDLALVLRRHLESDGYRVLLAGCGEDALWLAREERPHVIILDIMLPDLSGFAVLEALKAHPTTAPIPVVIASVLFEQEKGYALGAVDYLPKPVTREQLLTAARQALAHVAPQPHSLLVVEDDPDIRSMMQEALIRQGYNVSTATSGDQVLGEVTRLRPDLILLDLKMPGMDGYDVIRQLKGSKDTQSIPIIVTTASPLDKERDKIRVLGMGATHYFTKPLSLSSLMAEIKKAISEKQES
ncbi:MAG: GAF domain-containing protein [Anaerolineae bacterium]|nr:GAF domain-containing protein [Anaerolineae bacterium]